MLQFLRDVFGSCHNFGSPQFVSTAVPKTQFLDKLRIIFGTHFVGQILCGTSHFAELRHGKLSICLQHYRVFSRLLSSAVNH